ncbi:hypothetical protein [Streptomyces sp. NPDC002054]|uniref:imidazolonepropionase-like domain-containing protein n=1 Tax=Streptomyces sp. NPDC002054 TaxID=3154663 RepID=UPI0033264DDC
MLTLHTADLLVPGGAADEAVPLPGGAVLVEGDRIARVGPYEDLAGRYPHARVRRWPGLLVPGLLVHGAAELLERTYYPDDPYEVTELGAEPITGEAALGDLKMTEARWGHSARRGTQKLLARGVVAVTGGLTVPSVRTAVTRSGLTVLPAPSGGGRRPVSLDPFAGLAVPGEAYYGRLEAGAPARFAAFAVPTEAALLAEGATTCVATVIGGRLLHRRR